MDKYYEITVTLHFGVMASSKEDALEFAQDAIDTDMLDIPVRSSFDAYLTPNQAEWIQREAVNYE